jgi:hypothetical protein
LIRVQPAPEPGGFDAAVREPGLRALAEFVGERPKVPRKGGRSFTKVARRREEIPPERLPSYWTRALDDLMQAYQRVCAYACFRIHPVTGARSVDHMAPKSRAWDRVYEWGNYRLVCSLLNARKRDFIDLMDPFEVQDAWFELEPVGFQVVPAEHLDPGLVRRIDVTLNERLGLNAKRFRDARERDWLNYVHGRISYGVLIEESPFVAREIRRQGRLRDEDVGLG